MPASFGLECPHLHCTRVHNKGLQMPTSPCARAQLWRASKKMPASPPHTRVERYARPPLRRAYRDTRTTSYARPRIYTRRPPPACAKDGRAHMDACKDARVVPVARVAKIHASGRLFSLD